MNWLGDAPARGAQVEVQVRHRSPAARAEIIRVEGPEVEFALDEPVSAIAPGQSVVVYRGEQVLGGGIIERGARMRPGLPIHPNAAVAGA